MKFGASWMRLVGALMALGGLQGCSDAGAYPEDPDRPRMERDINSDVAWERGVSIGGTAEDSILLMPTRPSVSSEGIYLTDFAHKNVMRFDHDGSLIWAFGQAGSGPDEFSEPRDVRVDTHGSVWVLDTGNMRLTVLDSLGRVQSRIRLSIGDSPLEVIPLEDGSAVLVGRDVDGPFTVVDQDGRGRHQIAFPWGRFSEMHHLSSQFQVAFDPTRSLWATTFSLGDGFFLFSDTAWTGARGWFVEEVRFPVPEVTQNGMVTTTQFSERPISAAVSATLSPERLYVLFGGRGDDRFRIVDAYDIKTGAYEESYLLPERAMYLSWFDGGFYALHHNPYPELVYWKPSNAVLE